MTGPDLDPHYRRWNQDDIVDRFAGKSAGDFFDSETRLLKPIASTIKSVIDIGCASGRFVELLTTLGATPRYTGLDLSEASVARARALYPAHDFHCVNALTFEPENTADLVNATGVMQHEPRFDDLLSRMISWSRRHVLFDVKLASMPNHLADIDRAYIASDPPMYFVVLSAQTGSCEEIAERRDISSGRDFLATQHPGTPTPSCPRRIGPNWFPPVSCLRSEPRPPVGPRSSPVSLLSS